MRTKPKRHDRATRSPSGRVRHRPNPVKLMAVYLLDEPAFTRADIDHARARA